MNPQRTGGGVGTALKGFPEEEGITHHLVLFKCLNVSHLSIISILAHCNLLED